MKNILVLLKLEFKNKNGDYAIKNKNSWLKAVGSLVLLGAVVYAIFMAAQLYFRMFDKAGMAYEALVLLFTLAFIFLLFTGISSTIKVLYYKGDNEILMRFPVAGNEVFISKSLFLIITQVITTTLVMAPFLAAYPLVVEVDPSYNALIALSIIFLIVIPYFLANVLAIPIMHLTNRIRNRFGVIIILLTILVTGMFAAYMLLFSKAVAYLKDSSFSVFSDEVVEIIRNISQYLIPTRYFADILVRKELYIAFPVLLMLTAVSLVAMMLVIANLYQKTLLKNVEVEGSAFKHVTKNRCRSIFGTLLRKEFIQVFRSVNYSFQYFVLACAMPVMVYFCNAIALEIGRNDIGEQISVGMTLLVMLIFATVITSFSATSISREGENFYHTKVMPVSIHTQLAVKFFMYFLVSFFANVICVVVLIVTKQMPYDMALWVFGVVETVSIALTLRSMRLDIRRPYFNLSGEGEVVNSNANTTTAVLMGFVVAVAVGIAGMLSAYLLGEKIMMIACSAIAAVFTVYSVSVYFFRLKKVYNRIAKH